MNSIWNGATANSASPFTTGHSTPLPGGGAAARFQSTLGSTGVSPGTSPFASPGLPGVTASPAPADSSSTTTDSSSTITSNDFLTLLVTEMQNQDPTAQTDPNEYINQLVQINSLEQLISINQNLSTVLSTATTPTTPSPGAAPASSTTSGNALSSPQTSAEMVSRGLKAPGHSHMGSVQTGNLSVPSALPAATVVAHSLDGKTHAAVRGHAIRDIPTR